VRSCHLLVSRIAGRPLAWEVPAASNVGSGDDFLFDLSEGLTLDRLPVPRNRCGAAGPFARVSAPHVFFRVVREKFSCRACESISSPTTRNLTENKGRRG
jgi:hypothetical protein